MVRGLPVEPDARTVDVDLAVDNLAICCAVQGTGLEAKDVDQEGMCGLDVGVDEHRGDGWRGGHRFGSLLDGPGPAVLSLG